MKTPPKFHFRMVRLVLLSWLVAIVWLSLLATAVQAAEPAPVLIAHPGVPKVDAATVARLYTGRAVEVAGQPVVVANAAPGSALRQRFLAVYLQQDEDKYRAYWTVRRHVGKGVPPPDLPNAATTIDWVQSTPGAVGYVDATDLRAGLNVVARP